MRIACPCEASTSIYTVIMMGAWARALASACSGNMSAGSTRKHGCKAYLLYLA